MGCVFIVTMVTDWTICISVTMVTVKGCVYQQPWLDWKICMSVTIVTDWWTCILVTIMSLHALRIYQECIYKLKIIFLVMKSYLLINSNFFNFWNYFLFLNLSTHFYIYYFKFVIVYLFLSSWDLVVIFFSR